MSPMENDAPIVSYRVSIAVQIVSFIVSIVALIVDRADANSASRDRLAYQTLVIETIVNVIQLAWYVTAPIVFLKKNTVPDTRLRYTDWFLTTPLMLLSLVAIGEFFGDTGIHSLAELFREHGRDLTSVFLANLSMLIFGLLATYVKNPIKKYLIWVGFLPFLHVWIIVFWSFTANTTGAGVTLHVLSFFVWLLYGVLAHFSNYVQSIGYNILDMIAKNVTSLIITVIILF